MRSGLAAALAIAGALALGACSVGATPTAEPTPRPTPPDPPRAVLSTGSGELGEGQVGSYSIGTMSSDSPWLRGTAATVAAATPLTVELRDGLRATAWTASYVPIDSLTGPAAALGEGTGAIAFSGPPAGHWSLLVFATFDGGGSGAFYWDLLIEQP